MEHAEARDTQAIDRYLLGELNAAEADAFEEHYFDCADCADELRSGMQFMDGGRKVARDASAPAIAPVVAISERRSRRMTWIPALAAAVLVLAIGTPLLMRQRTAVAPSFEVARQHSFLLSESRSAGTVPTLDGNAPLVLWVDVPSEPTYSRYEARVHQPDGKVLVLSFSPDADGDATALTVRGLGAGSHELVIVGTDPEGQHAEIARHRFIVNR